MSAILNGALREAGLTRVTLDDLKLLADQHKITPNGCPTCKTTHRCTPGILARAAMRKGEIVRGER